MLSAALLLFANTLLFSLRLSGSGSFPKPLSAAEEREWLDRYAKGDPEARNVLIERNLRLVAHIVKKYYTQSSDQEDLISIGTIGLIKAVSTFCNIIRTLLEGGYICGHNNEPFGIYFGHDLTGKPYVPQMHGVKAAAENSGAHFFFFPSPRSIFGSLGLRLNSTILLPIT